MRKAITVEGQIDLIPSELNHAIAEALAWERGRDYPSDADWHDAAEKADKWNRQRVELGLEPYR